MTFQVSLSSAKYQNVNLVSACKLETIVSCGCQCKAVMQIVCKYIVCLFKIKTAHELNVDRTLLRAQLWKIVVVSFAYEIFVVQLWRLI